jgi:hypothetical protein
MRHMSPEEVEEAFRDKEHQRSTIKCAIREVIANGMSLSYEIKQFLIAV